MFFTPQEASTPELVLARAQQQLGSQQQPISCSGSFDFQRGLGSPAVLPTDKGTPSIGRKKGSSAVPKGTLQQGPCVVFLASSMSQQHVPMAHPFSIIPLILPSTVLAIFSTHLARACACQCCNDTQPWCCQHAASPCTPAALSCINICLSMPSAALQSQCPRRPSGRGSWAQATRAPSRASACRHWCQHALQPPQLQLQAPQPPRPGSSPEALPR